MRKFSRLAIFCLVFIPAAGFSQSKIPASLYEQASEVSGLITQYDRDKAAINDFYSPANVDERTQYQYRGNALNSPEQRKRLQEIARDYLKTLRQNDFNSFSVYAKVDYILLKQVINADLAELEKEDKGYKQIEKYITVAAPIYELEKKRRHGATVDGQKIAAELDGLLATLKKDTASVKAEKSLDMETAKMLQQAINGLKARLTYFYSFYNQYDPDFTWWVPETYKQLDKALGDYANMAIKKGKLVTTQKKDESGIEGVPIGRDMLIAQLQDEMIPYTPEQLIAIANKELAWCDAEMLKATKEMGFGTDWKKALEKVKNTYVPVGQQPELIVKLYNDAIKFIKERDLITIPPLADETWGMIMMSAQRQLVNPFFTGGKEISVSYPTNTMTYADRMMSMRGNNPYFSRGTVQHELIPGHHLQYFMNSRYKAYRRNFRTPFSGEGWALYWELLLYDKGFAKSPEERIGMLFWRMHRCARIIFSLNYHLGNWGPQQCIDFLVDRVGHERANAEGEVRRSFQGNYSPLYQVAYLIGGLQLFELKKELVDSGKMTFKQFHDAAIKENQIPIEMLRATLLNQKLSPDFTTSWKFYGPVN